MRFVATALFCAQPGETRGRAQLEKPRALVSTTPASGKSLEPPKHLDELTPNFRLSASDAFDLMSFIASTPKIEWHD